MMRTIDWIWNIRGSVALAPGLSRDDAFDRLDPLFGKSGTQHERTRDTLTFRKRDQAAQDKMSIFDGGTLRIEKGLVGSTLRYRLTSNALLFCFLAPLLFLAIAQLTVFTGSLQHTPAKKAEKSAKADKAKPDAAMNPIDKWLGAPAPEKKDAKKAKADDDEKPSPTAAYVFAAMFAALYCIGRVLEDRLVRTLFRRQLRAPAGA